MRHVTIKLINYVLIKFINQSLIADRNHVSPSDDSGHNKVLGELLADLLVFAVLAVERYFDV